MTKKLLVFDMDDTLITENMWLRFNIAMGMSEKRDYELYKEFSSGAITYSEWTTALEAEYRTNVSKSEIEKTLETYTLADGAGEAVTTAKTLGLQTAVITGSFLYTAEHLARTLQIDHVCANTTCQFTATPEDANVALPEHFLKSTPDGRDFNVAQYFVRLESRGEESTAKVTLLEGLCSELGIKLTDCIAVGDGANDIPLFEATECGVTFTNAKPAVQAAAMYTVDGLRELTDVLRDIQDTAQT